MNSIRPYLHLLLGKYLSCAGLLACSLLFSALTCQAEEALDPLLWQGSASNNSERAHRAFDGNDHSRWDTGSGQAAGQWLQVDMSETRSISRLEVDTTGSSNDYSRRFELSVSEDGKNWTKAKSGEGSVVTKIAFNPQVRARYFRITIPEGSDLTGGFWSVHEIRAYGDADPFALPRPAIRWRTIQPEFPTRDVVVAGYDIRDFKITPAQGEDATQAIRLATSLLAKAGGGTLWLPSGHYKISEPIVLKNNVTIRGDWAKPEPGKPIQGTILEMTANRGNAEAAPGISLFEASAVVGVAFWYPEQNPANITPYPVTVKQYGGVGMALENITFVNSYQGFACGPEGSALFFMRNLYGTVLETGIKIDSTVDIGRMEKVRFSPHYWSGSGLPNSPAADGPHLAWMQEKGTGLVFRRNDWSYAYDVEIEGYNIGLRTLPSLGEEDVSQNRKSYPNGNNAKFRFVRCQTAIAMEDVAAAGLMFQDSDIIECQVGILAEETFAHALQVQNCRISKTPVAIRLLGTGHIMVTSSDLDGAIENKTGYISFAGGKSSAIPNKGGKDGAGAILLLPDPGIPAIKNPYTTPEDRIAPPTNDIAVVTDPAYGAKGDEKTDDTAAVKKAIAAMAVKGGTVFFPGGEYRITQELVIPTGVELRGVNEAPHHAQTKGSVIDIIPGRGQVDGTPFITLSAKSGLRGLTFHYPEQDALSIVPYPWMIRGAGEEVWAVNVSCTMAYQLLDLATNKCDRHYIDYVAGHGLLEAFRIGGGSVGGRLLNCQLNPNYYAFTTNYSNSPNKMSPANAGKYMDPVFAYAKLKGRAFVIGDCTEQILFQNFVFGAKQGLVLTGQIGPSGWCLGHGSDQCQWGLWVDKIGPAGLPLINSQLVTVGDNGPMRGYIGLAETFTGTVYALGMDAWGDPATALRVLGGKLVLASTNISKSGGATLTMEGKGQAFISNALLRDVAILVERDNKLSTLEMNGILIQRDRKFEIYPNLADVPSDLIAFKVAGTLTNVDFPAGDALPVQGWKFKSNANEGEGGNALDGNPSTRWATGRSAQKNDEVVIDMGKAYRLAKIRVDCVASPGDFPGRMTVYLSTDGRSWGEPIYSGRGEADLKIGLSPQNARYIKIVNLSSKGGYWSIHEIQASEK